MFKLKCHKSKGHFAWRWGRLFLLAGIGGAALAGLLNIIPLRQEKTRGLPKRERLIGILPATLARPTHLLILGIDNTARGQSRGLRGNSDTMLLVRIDPFPPRVTLLSIPRDTRVRIRGKIAKINSANPSGGVELAAHSVSQLLGGVAIDRYVRIGTEGLVAIGSALGGVEVDVPKAMHYEDRTQKLSIHFERGSQVLNGRQLQEYMRFRKDNLGDIGRVKRQQQVLQAMIAKFFNPLTLVRLPFVVGAIQQNVDSDLSLGEMVALTQVIARTPENDRKYLLLPGRASSPSEYALSYWLPNPNAIKAMVSRNFAVTSGDRPSTQTIPIPVAVANGTQIPKLAAKTVFFLQEQGFSQAYISRQPPYTNLSRTQILVPEGERQAAERIKRVLGVGQVKFIAVAGKKSRAMVVVGSDFTQRLKAP